MAITQNRFTENYADAERPTSELWHPEWLVDDGNEVQIGIVMDDGCYVVLAQTHIGHWRPITHIPVEAAKMIGRLAGC